MQRLGRLQHVDAGAAAHLEVADDDVEGAFMQLLDRRIAVRRLFYFVAPFGNRLREPAAKGVVVVSNQNAAHARSLEVSSL
ncbi:hypothetical protein D3C83_70570 [compost metagenome]